MYSYAVAEGGRWVDHWKSVQDELSGLYVDGADLDPYSQVLSDDLHQGFDLLVDSLLLFGGVDQQGPTDERVVAAVHRPKAHQDAVRPQLPFVTLNEQTV